MLRMVSYPHRLKSGHITCYLNRTYHVLTTDSEPRSCRVVRIAVWWSAHCLPSNCRGHRHQHEADAQVVL